MYRFGIIGFGAIGRRHWRRIEENRLCDLIAIADIDAEALKRMTDEDVRQFYDYQDLLAVEKVDVVAVCTPNYLHAEMTIAALQAGKHVICEKPMCLKVANSKKMVNAALKYGKKLFIVKQNRYNPPIKVVQRLVVSGKLGRIFSLVVNCYWNRNDAYYEHSPWRGRREMDGGVLYTQFSHFIDLVDWLADSELRSVYAVADNFNHSSVEIEDTGTVCIQFENGVLATVNFTNCSYRKNMEGSVTVFAEKGTVKIGGQYLNELEYQQMEFGAIEELPVSSGPNDYGEYKGTMSNHHLVYENVVNTLEGREVIDVNGMDGMKTVEIIEAAYKSIEERKVILF